VKTTEEFQMPNPNPAIIPGVPPTEIVPERDDLLPEEETRFGDDADSKDGMPNDTDTLEPGVQPAI
jgi:hypothetical protein